MCYPYVQERNMWSHRILYSLEYRIIPNLCLLSNFIPIRQISVIHLKVTHTSPPHLQFNSLLIFISRYSSTSHLNHWWQCYLNQTSTFSWKTRESSLVLKFKPCSGKLLRNANSEIKPLINGASSNRFIIAISFLQISMDVSPCDVCNASVCHISILHFFVKSLQFFCQFKLLFC